jgi:protein SCO1/2
VKLRIAAMIAAACLAAACDKFLPASGTPFQGVDITGANLGGEIRLADATGKPRSLADFRGKVVVVIFGYTNCPDVCPTSLAAAAEAMRQLGDEAAQVQVLFVTVDPKRDTREVLAQYVPAFDPRFIGLTGDAAAVDKVAKDFKMYVVAHEARGGNYAVDHSGQIFAMDRLGKPRLMFAPNVTPAAMASDLRILLRS